MQERIGKISVGTRFKYGGLIYTKGPYTRYNEKHDWHFSYAFPDVIKGAEPKFIMDSIFVDLLEPEEQKPFGILGH